MRESMRRLTPQFSANRVVRRYVEQHYLSAALAYRKRAAAQGAMGAELIGWQTDSHNTGPTYDLARRPLIRKTGSIFSRFKSFLTSSILEAVAVELYAEAKNGHAQTREPAARGDHLVGSANGFTYSARIPATRPVADYTPRLVPHHDGAFVPLEAPLILWYDSPSWR